MLSVHIDETNGIALFEPNGRLSEGDFESAVGIVDPWIEKHGKLKGLVIHAKAFPGWDSFGALVSHLQFVRNHHRKVERVAFATDSATGNVAEKGARYFIAAEIELFPYDSLEAAKSWAAGGDAEHSA